MEVEVLIVAVLATLGVIFFQKFMLPAIRRMDRQNEEREFTELDTRPSQILEDVLRNCNGEWISLESLHIIRCKNYYQGLAKYLWITERDCDALVRGGSFLKDVKFKNGSSKTEVRYRFVDRKV